MGRLTTTVIACALSPLVVAGCGGGAQGMLEGTTALEVAAPAQTAPRYETDPTAAPVTGDDALAAAVQKGVEKAAGAHDTNLRGDGRLALLASWTADHLGEGGTPPPHEVVEFFAHHLGLVEPTPHLLIRGQPDPAALEDGIRDSVSQFLSRLPYDYWGAAVIEREGLTLAIVALALRKVELDPVPRTMAPGTPIVLRGKLGSGYSSPSVAVATPDGEVLRRQAGESKTVSIDVPTGETGKYGVELIAEGPRGDSVVANFPVYVGVDVPGKVVLETDADEAPSDAEDVERALMRLLNETRTEHGLPPVKRHEGLGEVATAHSRDMVDGGFVGHTSPTTGTAPERVKRAGFKSGLILENIGRGYTPKGIHRGLLQSPGHRANIMNPDVTHVGIGVVGEEEGERTAFVATEVFIRMAAPIDVEAAPEELLSMINEGRDARGADELDTDENLQQAAQEAADRFFDDASLGQQEVVDDASASLRRFSLAFERVGGLMVVVQRLDEASKLEPVFDPDARYIGIGVAQGNRPDTESNALAVVILLGWPR